MTLIKALLIVAAVALFTVGAVRADTTGTDSKIVIGSTPPGSPTCTDFQGLTTSGGTISADCTVEGSNDTSITFYVPTADLLGGGLTCSSSLSTTDGWTATSGSQDDAGTPVSTCTFTAPTTVTSTVINNLIGTGDPYKGYNDGDCDLDDDVLGVPVGCDITFSTPSDANITNGEVFMGNSPFGVSFDGTISAFPEPGSLALLLVGLLPLVFLRRRATQQ